MNGSECPDRGETLAQQAGDVWARQAYPGEFRERAAEGKPALCNLPRPPQQTLESVVRQNAALSQRVLELENELRWAEIALRGTVPLVEEVAHELLRHAQRDPGGTEWITLQRLRIRGYLRGLIDDSQIPPRPPRPWEIQP